MKKYILSVVLSLLVLSAFSQKLYFVYLQAENDQPFYVRMNEKVISSSASGYLILPKLRDSIYNFVVGFPQNKWPEQQFSVTIGRKDHGYLVKNFAEKGWGLFDLQSLEVIMSVSGKTSSANGENGNVSGFTAILSKAADDPSLKEKKQPVIAEEKKTETVVVKSPASEEIPAPAKKTEPPVVETAAAIAIPKKEEPVQKTETVKAEPLKEEQKNAVTTPKTEEPVQKTETAKTDAVKTETPKEEQKSEAVTTAPEKTEIKTEIKEPVVIQENKAEDTKAQVPEEYKMSTVVRRSESSTTEGFGLVYLDKYENGVTDTVRLLIPNPKQWLQAAVREEVKEEKKMLDIPVEVVKAPDTPAAEKTVTAETVVPNTAPAEGKESKTTVKSNCPEVAAEADFFKLRKTMAAAENDEDMTSEAKKYFRQKCFTTAQIRNLCTLYLTDQGKYQFFDVAYTHASDPENYTTLQAELKEEYYINRFRAMLRN